MSTETQRNKILEYLINGGRLTALEAQKLFGCMRLSARILELKERFNIRSQFISVKNRDGESVKVKEYWMEVIDA